MTERYRKRVHDLKAHALLLRGLTNMPDRVNAKDILRAADILTGAADDLEALFKATPPGCVCRRVVHDDYDYLDYEEACLHHQRFYTLSVRLKADYAKMERTLKNEVRLKLVAAALAGTAMPLDSVDIPNGEILAARAISIADETIRQLTEPA